MFDSPCATQATLKSTVMMNALPWQYSKSQGFYRDVQRYARDVVRDRASFVVAYAALA